MKRKWEVAYGGPQEIQEAIVEAFNERHRAGDAVKLKNGRHATIGPRGALLDGATALVQIKSKNGETYVHPSGVVWKGWPNQDPLS